MTHPCVLFRPLYVCHGAHCPKSPIFCVLVRPTPYGFALYSFKSSIPSPPPSTPTSRQRPPPPCHHDILDDVFDTGGVFDVPVLLVPWLYAVGSLRARTGDMVRVPLPSVALAGVVWRRLGDIVFLAVEPLVGRDGNLVSGCSFFSGDLQDISRGGSLS